MPAATFHYRARAADGRIRTGVITAEDARSAARQLAHQGLAPISVGAGEKTSGGFQLPSFAGGTRDVLFLTQELSTLLNSGVPLDRALSITSELTTRPRFRSIVLDILRSIKGGKSLADSLALHRRHFSDLFVNMVRAGEASGSLGQIFERLSEFERSRDELRNYIVSSMVYPALRGRARSEHTHSDSEYQRITPGLYYGTSLGSAASTEGAALRDCVSVYGSEAADVNTARRETMIALGLAVPDADALIARRWEMPFLDAREFAELQLSLGPAGGRLRIGGNTMYTFRATARLKTADRTLSHMRRSVGALIKFNFHGNLAGRSPG